jgi:hypothetical protein
MNLKSQILNFKFAGPRSIWVSSVAQIKQFWLKRRNEAFAVRRASSGGDGILLAAAQSAA